MNGVTQTDCSDTAVKISPSYSHNPAYNVNYVEDVEEEVEGTEQVNDLKCACLRVRSFGCFICTFFVPVFDVRRHLFSSNNIMFLYNRMFILALSSHCPKKHC